MVAALTGAAEGFYDPEVDTLYLVRDPEDAGDSTADRLILAHELAHAVDDARWPLDSLFEDHGTTLDGEVAVATLLEGSATVQMLRFAWAERAAGRLDAAGEHALEHWSAPHIEELRGTPAFILHRFFLPYIIGTGWLAGRPSDAFLAAEVDPSRARLGEAMAAPPQTMRDILHPDRPPLVPVTAPLASAVEKLGMTVQLEERVGELLTAAALGRDLPARADAFRTDAWTSAAADGWVGDAFVLAEASDGARDVEVWVTAWQGGADRDEFLAAWGARGEVDRLGERVAVVSWGLEEGERARLLRALRRGRYQQGQARWRP